jgi:hypothetical protein
MFTKSPLKNPQSTIRNPQSVHPLEPSKTKRGAPPQSRQPPDSTRQPASAPTTDSVYVYEKPIEKSAIHDPQSAIGTPPLNRQKEMDGAPPPASSTHAGVISGEALWTTEIAVE